MKLTILTALFVSFSALAGTPVSTLVPVDNIYVPKGFDSNDNSEVVISGYLPNLCHKSPETKISRNGNKIDITVTALKYDPTNPFCPEVIVPFIEGVKLGVLDKGNYEITVNGKSMYERKSEIFIEESTSGAIDEFVYANVEYVEKVEGSRDVVLRGYNPSACFVLDEIEVFDNGKDVYSVLPKMKQVSDFCPMKMTAFEYEMEVPKTLNKSRVLIHVRAMDGSSVNSLFYNSKE